jgi:hypothetical protein
MKPKYVQVKDQAGLFRDSSSNAILNLDETNYIKYKKTKEYAKIKREEEQHQEQRLNNLEQDVSELKHGIAKILELLKHGT